jgi:hypothetical protein
VIPEDERAFVLARRLRALPRPQTVVLMSSASRTAFDTKLDGLPFIAKADLCSTEVLRALRAHQAARAPGSNLAAGHQR